MKWIKWLLPPLVLTILAVLLMPLLSYVGYEHYVHKSLRNFWHIRGLCLAYAQTHEGKFPDGKSSNEALRQLFVAGYISDESIFSECDYPSRRPDGNIGNKANGFLEALAPGECPLYYVRGLTTEPKDSLAPLLYARVVVFDGNGYLVCASAGGNAKVYETDDGDVIEEHDGRYVDIFSEAYLKEKYGIEPQDILKPEGPPRDLTAIAKARKQHLHALEAGILALIWLPFLLTVWIKHRRAAMSKPPTLTHPPILR